MLANGPPWTKAGVCSSVCTRFGFRAVSYTHLRAVCESTGLSKQTVNSALRKLEADGILYLEPSGARSKRVCLTEAGLRVADATAGRLIRLENSIFDEWPAEDVQQYLRCV